MSYSGRIAAMVDSCCQGDRQLFSQFEDRGYCDWLYREVNTTQHPRDMVIAFALRLMRGNGASSGYFVAAFSIVVALAADDDAKIQLRSGPAGFRAAIVALYKKSPPPTLVDWSALLEREVLSRA